MKNRYDIDVTAIKVGDVVEFKSDVEQTSAVHAIARDWRGPVLTVTRSAGEYGRGRYQLSADDVFGHFPRKRKGKK